MGKTLVFPPIAARESLSKKVATAIEEVIRSKKLVSGSRLPSEQELCGQFGVSRTVVREAVRMLTARGLTSVVKGKGIFVRPFSADTVTGPFHLYLQMQSERNHVLDVVHARQLIEPPIAAAAALKRSDEDIGRLRSDIDQLRGCKEDFRKLAALDQAFHLDIARACQNPLMPLLLEPINRLMPEIKSSVYATVQDAKDSAIVWHEKVLTKIMKQDDEGARQAMSEHLKIAEQHAIQMLRARKPSSRTHHRTGQHS